MTRRITEPLMTLWFGNFYRPAFDDRAFIDQSVRSIRDMGFNCIQLDSKAWEDFQARFAGGEASDYVAQQEYMLEAIHREGLAHSFMALYLNGDNLYPNVRFSPPIYGESVVRADGSDGRWYRYWSEAAQDSQRDHVAGLMRLYREGHAQTEQGLPICSMWDPIVAPSFDEEGQQRYKTWLKARYGDIRALNAAYRTDFSSFDALTPQDYWFTVRCGESSCYALADLREKTPAFVMWADNMRWQADELTAYFAAMKEKLHAVDPALYLMPCMAQWSHLLNIDTSRKSDIGFCELWDTAVRGIDMRALAPHVDMCHYYTVPVTIDGDPDAYVVSCQHAHIRSLNPGRPFLGGVYWGRFLYNDVYRYVTPEEIVGSITGSGASGISAYGYGGMDDGGLLHRMDEGFCGSLARANAWARAVMPRLGRRRQSRAAILFPTAMALLEPLKIEGADCRRLDLLGLYHQCCDLGFAPDIVEAEDVRSGLDGYDVLLIAADDCYHAQRNMQMEEPCAALSAGAAWSSTGSTARRRSWPSASRRRKPAAPATPTRARAACCWARRMSATRARRSPHGARTERPASAGRHMARARCTASASCRAINMRPARRRTCRSPRGTTHSIPIRTWSTTRWQRFCCGMRSRTRPSR